MNYLSLIEDKLDEYLIKTDYLQTEIFEAMRYSVLNGGKRIRPTLLLEFCRICGGNINDALPFACAIECIHAYSLIHDDLPCMDDDDFRRGKPTTHKLYGEATALLAGDALITLAFNIACDSSSKASDSQKIESIKELSAAAGVLGMVGGQTLDLMCENKKTDLELLMQVHTKKTGALIKAAAKIGAIIGNASNEQLLAAEGYSTKIGMVFQIIDDILDETGSFEELGKAIGSDKANRKSTFVTLLGAEESYKRAKKLTDEAVLSLSAFKNEADDLAEFAILLLNRKK